MTNRNKSVKRGASIKKSLKGMSKFPFFKTQEEEKEEDKVDLLQRIIDSEAGDLNKKQNRPLSLYQSKKLAVEEYRS